MSCASGHVPRTTGLSGGLHVCALFPLGMVRVGGGFALVFS